MSLEPLIDEARIMAYDGQDYMEIKKKMSLKAGSSENLGIVMVKADEFIAEYQLADQERGKVINFILIGIFLLILGLGLSLFTISLSGRLFYILLGAIILGAYLIIKNVIILRKPIEEFIPEKTKFSHRRKF